MLSVGCMIGVMNITADAQTIEAAARSLGIWDVNLPLPRMAGEVLRHLAGTVDDRHRQTLGGGGRSPKRAGRSWEITIVDHANESGVDTWDRAPLRGARDLLDVTGCLPGGWLVGAKSTTRGVSAAVKMADAMDQCHRAMAVLEDSGRADGVIPWQIVQRPNAPTGRAYAVTEYDWMLQLVKLRSGWKEAG